MKSYRQIFKYDDRLGFKYMPNLSLTILGNPSDNMRDYKIITDKYGFRNNKSLEELKNIENLFIGCSFTAGDGVDNSQRFTNKLISNSYNAALSGSDFIQQCLIAEDFAKLIRPKRVFFSPYIGCLQRNTLKERKMQLINFKKSWPKPYAEIIKNKIVFKNIPVPKPYINFDNFSKIKKKSNLNIFVQRVRDKILRGKDFLDSLDNYYKLEQQYKICKHCLLLSKGYFKESKLYLMPIPNWEFQKLANLKLINRVRYFYDSLANDLNIKHFFLNDYLERNYASKMYYLEGHLNPFGHQKVADILNEKLL